MFALRAAAGGSASSASRGIAIPLQVVAARGHIARSVSSLAVSSGAGGRALGRVAATVLSTGRRRARSSTAVAAIAARRLGKPIKESVLVLDPVVAPCHDDDQQAISHCDTPLSFGVTLDPFTRSTAIVLAPTLQGLCLGGWPVVASSTA